MMLKSKLKEFINDPYNLKINLELGYYYEGINQYASAISHYMRGAEFGLDSNLKERHKLVSECLLRAAEVFLKLGSRLSSTKELVNHSISTNPESPQSYLLLTKIYEKEQNWHECNTAAILGIYFIDRYQNQIYNDLGKEDTLNQLLFQKAVSNYHLGRVSKAKIDFEVLRRKPGLKKWMFDAINNSLNNIGQAAEYNQIGYQSIDKFGDVLSFSQCLQDVFIVDLFGKNCNYLEIGSGDPIKNSNTYLLEKYNYWSGISIDVDKDLVNKFKSTRNNKVILGDSRFINYEELNLPEIITYLQVDCEPPQITLEALYNIPFNKHKFAFITFEHDAYRGEDVREKSREYLEKLGYELLIPNVAYNRKNVFEDWWINQEIIAKYNVPKEKITKIKNSVHKDMNTILDIYSILN